MRGDTRVALMRQLQEFIEFHLRGMVRWQTAGDFSDLAPPGTIRLRDPEMHEKKKGHRQLMKLIVAVDFDGWALQAFAPDEAPPLGRIVCFHPEHGSIDGPLDTATWERVAAFIKERHHANEHA